MAFDAPMEGFSPTFVDVTITGDLEVQGDFNFNAVGVNNLHLGDDDFIGFGNVAATPDVRLLWETADANANAFLFVLPVGGAVDVPVAIFGDDTALNKDLGLFNGITDPTMAVLSDDATKYISMSHDGTYGDIKIPGTSSNFIRFTIGNTTPLWISTDVVNILDNIPLAIGSSEDAELLFETVDANANALVLALPDGGATNVSVCVIGDKGSPSVVNADLGLFHGITDPTLAILDESNDDYIRFYHDGTNAYIDNKGGNIIVTPDDGYFRVLSDVGISFGGGTPPAASFLYETADTNANALVLALPDHDKDGGAVHVPVLVIGDQDAPTVINTDLGLFNGITTPTIAILDTSNADYISFGHNGTDANIITNNGDILLNIGGGNLAPSANDGVALGTTALMWSDLFLASGAVINFDNGDLTITHSSNALNIAGGGISHVNTVGISTAATPFTPNVEYAAKFESDRTASTATTINVALLALNEMGDATPGASLQAYAAAFSSDMDGGGGTVAESGGIIIQNEVGASVTATDHYGLRVLNPVAGGTITTNYGIRIDDQTSGGTDYGLYIEGADTLSLWVDAGTSRFDDDVDLGSGGGAVLKGGGIQFNQQTSAAGADVSLDKNDGVVSVTTGAGSSSAMTLPECSTVLGQVFTFYLDVDGAQDLVITCAGGDSFSAPGDVGDNTATMNDVDDFIVIQAVNDDHWLVINSQGVVLTTV